MDRMKTHSNDDQPKELSDVQFEAALHAALRDEGCFFPTNAEEVASLEESMDMDGVPTPDMEKFRQMLRQKTEKIVELPSTAKLTCSEVNQNLENLAMAARNGGEITDEVRKRMEADRSRAKEQVRSHNGAH
jgi:hypothetical protein